MLLIPKYAYRFSFAAKMSEVLKRDLERAQRVQENVVNNNYTIEAEAKLRQKISIQSSIQQLENEMRGEIAKSLKRSESKLVHLIQKTNRRYCELQKSAPTQEEVTQYNQTVALCEKARWEFMVHRQAIGFTIRNYELVTTLYKIPPKI